MFFWDSCPFTDDDDDDIPLCSCQGINLTNCRYDSGRLEKPDGRSRKCGKLKMKIFFMPVRRAAEKLGIKETKAGEDWTLFWSDARPCEDKFKEMKPYQKINHLPSMTEICHKNSLATNWKHMLKFFPKDYNIFPRTWTFPIECTACSNPTPGTKTSVTFANRTQAAKAKASPSLRRGIKFSRNTI
ncbi:tubulin polyglutamylase ttll6-like [Syngnathoides biaculeatus]|uniref:tubulin polyglutamylase ttll6-like n=1 Tax=Syngnathoides biaculeatus TaxID=300417 RepID=UPI002ADD3CED|nr:tubulin polyglutamylase ttll6-like [Syngnathoides biaculeatus]